MTLSLCIDGLILYSAQIFDIQQLDYDLDLLSLRVKLGGGVHLRNLHTILLSVLSLMQSNCMIYDIAWICYDSGSCVL